jgi:hypothetical protein
LAAVLYLSFVLKRIGCGRLFLYDSIALIGGLGYAFGGGFGLSVTLSVSLSVGFNLDVDIDIDIDIDICRYTDLIGGLGLL